MDSILVAALAEHLEFRHVVYAVQILKSCRAGAEREVVDEFMFEIAHRTRVSDPCDVEMLFMYKAQGHCRSAEPTTPPSTRRLDAD